MMKRALLGCVTGLLISATASAAVLPGYAGFASPFGDYDVWVQDEGRLALSASDTNWHFFVVPIAVHDAAFSQSLTVKWQHTIGCVNPCLGDGEAEARLTVFNADGSIASSANTWDATSGFRSQTQSVPASGSAIFRVRMKMGSLQNSHSIARVVSSGAAAL